MIFFRLSAPLIALLLFLLPGTGMAALFQVNSGYDVGDLNPGDGRCVAYLTIAPPYVFAHCTLRAAIQEANALPGADQILLQAGTYLLEMAGQGEDQAITGDYDILDNLTISGEGVGKTIIDAHGLDRIFEVTQPGTTLTLADLSLVNGRLQASTLPGNIQGAGIANRGILQISNCSLENNSIIGYTMDDGLGGGIYNQGRCTVTNSTLQNNSAVQGGGIYNADSGDLVLINSTVALNRATSGAGLANAGLATMTNTTISGNRAAVDIDSLEAGAMTSTGGGMNNRGTLYILQTTIAENQAQVGGGIDNSGRLELVNTLLAANQGGNCRANATIVSLGHNLDQDGSCQMAATTTDIRYQDPLLAPLADNGGSTYTHAISHASPAANRGAILPTLSTDQRGHLRTLDAGYDIGAFEAPVSITPILVPLLPGH